MASYSSTNAQITVTLDLNKLGDTAIFVPFGKFYVENIRLTNVTTTLAGSSATLGFNAAPAAAGTAIVTVANGVVTPLTAATVVSAPTIASAAATVTPTTVNGTGLRQIYANVGVVHGAAVTCTAIIKMCRVP